MTKPSELISIQYLRGIAATFVVFHHLSFMLNRLDSSFRIFHKFQSGVDLFFVISGFVMVYSTAGGTKITAIDFAKKRIIRIVPLYWLATCAAILVFLVAPQLFPRTSFDVYHIIESFAFYPAHGHLVPPIVPVGWTLNHEMFFYFIFTIGMVISALSGRRLTVVFTSVILVGLTLLHPFMRPDSAAVDVYTSPLGLEFLFGMLLALFVTQRPTYSPVFITLTVAGLFAMILLYEPLGYDRVARYGLLATAIIAFSLLTRWPKLTLLELVGDSSYSLYLSHFFTAALFAQLWRRVAGIPASNLSETLYYIVGVSFAIFVGIGIWTWIEAPLTRQLKQHRHLTLPMDEPMMKIAIVLSVAVYMIGATVATLYMMGF